MKVFTHNERLRVAYIGCIEHGKFPFHLRKESDFGGCHLVDGDALPRLGCDEDLVRGLGD